MIRYYSYYSSGGYKNFYLGSDADPDEKKFYLALLPVYEKKLQDKDDSELRATVEKLREIPKMKIVTSEERHNLPKRASNLITHGGYKVAYLHLGNDQYALAIRDISGNDNDETGRNTPFLFLFVSDDRQDMPLMDKLAVFCTTHLMTIDRKISDMFYYDAQVNGLCFDLAAMNRFVSEVEKSQKNSILPLADKDYEIKAQPGEISLLVGTGIGKEATLKELSLSGSPLLYVEEAEVVPLDVPGALNRAREEYKVHFEEVAKKRKIRNLIISGVVIGVAAVVLLLWLVMKD